MGRKMTNRVFFLLLTLVSTAAQALPLQWATSSIETTQEIVEVFPTQQGFLALGSSGGVYHSINGLDWQDVSPPINNSLTAGIDFDGRWLVVGPEVGLWFTDNSGQTWEQAALPELEEYAFRPMDISRQFTETLVVIGKYGDPNACRTSAVVSPDSQNWSIVSEGTFPREHVSTQPTNSGLINFVLYDVPRCGGVTPIINPWGYFYLEGTAETGFGDFSLNNQIWTSDFNIFPVVTPSPMFEAGWFDGAFWGLDRNFIPDLPFFAIRRMTPPEFNFMDDVTYFDQQPFSLTDFREGVLISHQGLVSYVDQEGNLEQQALPETEAWYRLASNLITVVGVSPEGLVIRGDLTGSGIPINATHPVTLIILSLLFLAIAFSQFRPRSADVGSISED